MKEQVNELLRRIGLKAVEVKLEQMMTGDGQAALEAEVFLQSHYEKTPNHLHPRS